MTDSSAKGQKNPLDILESVLEDAKKSSVAKKEANEAAAESAKKEELAVMREQQDAVDEQLIAEQLTKMKAEVSQMPAQQARQAQDEAEKKESAQQESSTEGYKIIQLDHTKI